MEDYILELIQGCNNRDYNRAEEEDFVCNEQKTRVWKVQSDEGETLYYWNSANGQEPQHSEALRNIANELLGGNEGGNTYDGWNEIMFEIK
jgi:hypothetical protein